MTPRLVNCPANAKEGWEKPPTFVAPISSKDKIAIGNEILHCAVKSVLEFGPGDTTEFMAKIEHLEITTCEHVDKWFEASVKRFKDTPNVKVLKYVNTMPIEVIGLDPNARFDMGLVDSPAGYRPLRKIFPGYEECSRINTCLFALERCRMVLLHDANRPCERGTLGRLHTMGFEYKFIKTNIAVIFHGDTLRLDIPDTPQPGSFTPRPNSVSRGISVDQRPDRLDAGGTGKKRHSVRRGRGQKSAKRVRTAARAHSGVEGSA